MGGLPESAWFQKDQKDQLGCIRQQLERIRPLLFSADARKMLASVELIDAKIADVDNDIREAKEDKFLHPGKGSEDKYNARIAKFEARRRALEEQRAKAVRKILAELEAIGLHLSGETVDKCIFTVNVGDLVDAAVVARHVGLVVEALGGQMKSQGGDVVAARRYYEMYAAMLEVQKTCFDEYVAKSRNGPWRAKLAAIREEAEKQRAAAVRSSVDGSFSARQQAVFLKNAEVFETTLRAAAAYEAILDQHESVISDKADEVGKMLAVARNSLATVTLAGDFLALVQNAADSFDALVCLDIPPMELFDDAALQTEFAALNEKMK